MNSVLEFANHPDCITSYEAMRAHVRKTAEETGLHKVPYYYVNNIGLHTTVEGESDNEFPYIDVNDLRLYTSIWETKSRQHPNFIGNVDDLSDPRLSHLTIVAHGPWFYVCGEKPEDITFKPGDCDGAFRADATNPMGTAFYFQGWKWNRARQERRRESLYIDYLRMPSENTQMTKLVFTTLETAKAYCEWAKQDQASLATYQDHLADCLMMDRMLDLDDDSFDDGPYSHMDDYDES